MTQPALFTPFSIRSTTFRNRIWIAPMCQYSVLEEDGVPRGWHTVHLGALAVGGAGLVMAEATAVSPQGRITARDTGIWSDAHTAAWSPIVAFMRAQGARVGIQLAHAGRKASTFAPWGTAERGTVPTARGGWTAVAPSAVPFPGYAEPAALDDDGIERVVADFTSAAARAVEAGFEVIEVHAAHGYLLHEFLSPLSNRRDDAYGGSLENRARLLLRIVRAVRGVIGAEAPLFVRFSATEWTEGGLEVDEVARVATWAAEAGADLADVSTGGNVVGDIPLGPGYQVPYAEHVRAHSTLPTSAVGLITTPAQADEIVASGRADAVMIAREALRDPHFPLRAAVELGAELDYWPPQYARARLS